MPSWSGLKPDFTILDVDDQVRLLKQLLEAGTSTKNAAGARLASITTAGKPRPHA